MLKEGVLAPDFELPDQEKVAHKLSDYRGKKVVLYFIPRMIRLAAPRKHAVSEIVSEIIARTAWSS